MWYLVQPRTGGIELFKEIVAPSMKELFVQAIEHLILSEELPIGTKLPTERELASQMKVSRSIVNLGLNELERKGFIEIIPRQGTYVADYIRKGKLDTLMSIVNYNGGQLNHSLFNSIMEFRIINEGEVVYLAAKNRTESDLENIEFQYQKVLTVTASQSTDSEAISQAIFDFHHAIFCATGNTIFPLVFNAFENIYLLMIATIFRYLKAEETINQLKLIAEMIRIQDPKKAKEAMVELIQKGVEQLEKDYFIQ